MTRARIDDPKLGLRDVLADAGHGEKWAIAEQRHREAEPCNRRRHIRGLLGRGSKPWIT